MECEEYKNITEELYIDKQNRITAERAGAIVQDVHKKMNLDTSDEKVKKINSIEVGTVDGTIKQDVDE